MLGDWGGARTRKRHKCRILPFPGWNPEARNFRPDEGVWDLIRGGGCCGQMVPFSECPPLSRSTLLGLGSPSRRGRGSTTDGQTQGVFHTPPPQAVDSGTGDVSEMGPFLPHLTGYAHLRQGLSVPCEPLSPLLPDSSMPVRASCWEWRLKGKHVGQTKRNETELPNTLK